MTNELAGLETAIHDFARAWAEGDVKRLEALLSPTYTHNDAFGAHLPYADWLAYAARRTGRTTRIETRDLAIRRFGDVAVVTGYNDIRGGGATAPDDAHDLTIAFTQVWRREDGRWLREAFQATPVLGEIAR